MKKLEYVLQTFLEWPSLPLFMQSCFPLKADFWNQRMQWFNQVLQDSSFLNRHDFASSVTDSFYVDRLLKLYLELEDQIRLEKLSDDELEIENEAMEPSLTPCLQAFTDFELNLPKVTKQQLMVLAQRRFWRFSSKNLIKKLDAYLAHQMVPLMMLKLVLQLNRLTSTDQLEMIQLFHRILFSREDGILAFRQHFYMEWKQYLLRFEHYKLPLQIQIWYDAKTYLFNLSKENDSLKQLLLTSAAQIALQRNHLLDVLRYAYQDANLSDHANLLLLVARAARLLRAWQLCKILSVATMKTGLYLEEIYANLSYSHYNLQEYRQAISIARQGIERYRHRTSLYIALAYAQLYAGKTTQAMETFIKASQFPMLHHQLDLYLGMARTAYQLDQPYTVLTCIKKALHLSPENEATRREYAEYLYEYGYLKEALRELSYCLARNPSDVQLSISICTILSDIPGLSEKVRRLALDLLQRNIADTLDFQAQLAIISYNLGFPQKAWHFIERAIQKDEKNLSYWSILCDILIGEEAYTQALQVSEMMLKLDEKVHDSYLTKGDILIRMGEYDQALACYDLCQNKTGMSADLASGRKEIYGFLGLENERAKWENVEVWWRLKERDDESRQMMD